MMATFVKNRDTQGSRCLMGFSAFRRNRAPSLIAPDRWPAEVDRPEVAIRSVWGPGPHRLRFAPTAAPLPRGRHLNSLQIVWQISI